jgi:hypothetical protein
LNKRAVLATVRLLQWSISIVYTIFGPGRGRRHPRREAGLAFLMRQIGREVYKGRFETLAAQEVAVRVRQEIAR